MVDENQQPRQGRSTGALIVRDACPACGATRFKQNGQTPNGTQQQHCKACPRQFVQCAEPYRSSEETWALIERVLRERISLRGICRAVGVGLKWLRGFLVHCVEALPDQLHVQPITGNADIMLLWTKIPEAYRQQAMFYTDQYVVYAGVLPAAQHNAIHKLARRTTHVERFNNTLRQRVSRLARETFSFSKNLANQIGIIKYFICHYNLTRATA